MRMVPEKPGDGTGAAYDVYIRCLQAQAWELNLSANDSTPALSRQRLSVSAPAALAASMRPAASHDEQRTALPVSDRA